MDPTHVHVMTTLLTKRGWIQKGIARIDRHDRHVSANQTRYSLLGHSSSRLRDDRSENLGVHRLEKVVIGFDQALSKSGRLLLFPFPRLNRVEDTFGSGAPATCHSCRPKEVVVGCQLPLG